MNSGSKKPTNEIYTKQNIILTNNESFIPWKELRTKER